MGNAKAASAAAVAPGSEQRRKGLCSEGRNGLRGDFDSPLWRREAGDLEDAPGERAPGGSNICTSKFSARCIGSLLGVRVRAVGVGDGEAAVHTELQVLNLLGIGGVRGGDRPSGRSPRGLLLRMLRVPLAVKGV